MKEKKVFFVFPSKKTDSVSQTVFGIDHYNNKADISHRMSKTCLDSLLNRKLTSHSFLQKSISYGYSAHLSFLCSVLNDKRFDLLTPPNDLLSDYQESLTFDFFPQYFSINNSDGSHYVTYSYTHSSLALLECLESEIISPELASIIEKLHITSWNNGSLLCKCTDNRCIPSRVFLIPLTIGQSVIQSKAYKTNQTNIEKMDAEKQLLLLNRPLLCVDPSLDVARANSCLDFRKKLYSPDHTRKPAPYDPPKLKEQVKEAPVILTMKPLKEPIVVPEIITSMFSSLQRTN